MPGIELQQYQSVLGVFDPKRRDDLRPGVAVYIGTVCSWLVAWRIEEGPYTGQWALTPETPLSSLTWAPQEDVRIINPLRPGVG